MPNFAGWQQHVHLAAESTWGVTPGSPTYLYIPYATYDVRATPQSAQAALYTGVRQRRHNRIVKATLEGSLACPLFGYHVASKSIAQYLIEWATNGASSINLDSYLIERGENGADNKRHNGMRVNTMTLSGSADSGIVEISLALVGKQETGGITLQTLSATNPQPVEFLFSDLTMSIDSSAVDLRSFQITVNNNLQTYHNNSYWPSVQCAGVREVAFQFDLFKTDNTYDAMRRASAVNQVDVQLVLQGRHLGTGASGDFTQITIDMPRVNFANATDNGGLNELISQSTEWIVLKPDTTDNDINFTFGLDA